MHSKKDVVKRVTVAIRDYAHGRMSPQFYHKRLQYEDFTVEFKLENVHTLACALSLTGPVPPGLDVLSTLMTTKMSFKVEVLPPDVDHITEDDRYALTLLFRTRRVLALSLDEVLDCIDIIGNLLPEFGVLEDTSYPEQPFMEI